MKPEDITIKPIGATPYLAMIRAKDNPIATAIQDEADGLWRIYTWTVGGYVDAWVLRAIADRLDEMNREHNEALDAAYKALPDDEEDPFA